MNRVIGILWALNHPTEFENTLQRTLKKLIRGDKAEKSAYKQGTFYFLLQKGWKTKNYRTFVVRRKSLFLCIKRETSLCKT